MPALTHPALQALSRRCDAVADVELRGLLVALLRQIDELIVENKILRAEAGR